MSKLAFILVLITVFNYTDDILDPEKSSCIKSTTTLTSVTINFNNVTAENYEAQCNT